MSKTIQHKRSSVAGNQPGLASIVGSTTMNATAWDGSQLCTVGSTAKCATSP